MTSLVLRIRSQTPLLVYVGLAGGVGLSALACVASPVGEYLRLHART